VLGAVLCVGALGGAEVTDQKAAPAQKRVPEPLTANQKLLKLLDDVLETKSYEAPAGMSLKDFINLLRDIYAKHKGIELPILVDFDAFKEENPDVYKEPADLYDIKVTISQEPRHLTLRRILEQAVAKIPTNNATFIVRKNAIEITTVERTTPSIMFNTPVSAVFNNRRLADAFQELSGATGVSIVASPSVSNQLDNQISATFANTVPLKTAVKVLAEMADLKMVELPGVLYVTTQQNAEALLKDRKAQEQEELWRKRNKVPEFGPPGGAPKKVEAQGA
jgi:hypothetical protein